MVVIRDKVKVISFWRHHESSGFDTSERSTTFTTANAENMRSRRMRKLAKTRRLITFQLHFE